MRPRRAAPAALASIATVLGVVASPSLPAAAAPASSARGSTYAVPAGGVFTFQGHGWGHGHGMSQWGAYGAAKVRGMSYQQILSFYYPGTTLAPRSPEKTLRVLVHGTSDRQLAVATRAGHPLTATTDVAGMPACTLPDSLDGHTPVQQWRAKVLQTADGVRVRLQASVDGQSWSRPKGLDCAAGWRHPFAGDITFDGGRTTDLIRAGAVARYRGALRAAFTGSRIYVVDVVRLESYLRSVVPAEMPASWSPAALQAQAVAARTYATYGIRHPKNRAYYDVYDDTRDQMYVGVNGEVASSDAAIRATRSDTGRPFILATAKGGPAFTQFSSSDGGWTVSGGQPYLPAQKDPYDGLVPNSVHSWSTRIPAGAISAQFAGQIGALRSVTITGRDGNGAWGGRVTSMTLRGSAGRVTMSGATFRYSLGLRSEWFRVLVPPAAPGRLRAAANRSEVRASWQPPPDGVTAAVTGYRVVLRPGNVVQHVGVDARSATFTGLDPATDYAVAIAATSRAGRSPTVEVTTKVARLAGGSRVATAVDASRATFTDDAAGAVLLARRGGWAHTLAAAPLAAARQAPLLLATRTTLPAATRAELNRVLSAGGRVYLLGNTDELDDSVASQVAALGYHVRRLGGSTPASTARRVAGAVNSARPVTTAVEVSATDPASAWAAAAAAARRHGVLLLTNGTDQAPATRRWLAHHAQVTKRFAIGAAAAAADPSATPVGARANGPAAPASVAAAVAARFFAHPASLAVVASTASVTGAVAAARMALRGGPVLLAAGERLPSASTAYVHGTRATIARADLAGAGLPYADVESGLQAALLP